MALLAALMAITAAAGPAQAQARRPGPRATDPHEVSAQREADTLIALSPSSSTWTERTSPPTSALAHPIESLASPNLVSRTRYWEATTSWDAVVAAVSRAPAGLRPSGSGSTGTHGVVTTRSVSFAAPATPAWSAYLFVTTAPMANGHIGVRADAQVSWVPTRDAAELASPSVTSATLSVWDSFTHRVWVRRVVTDPATVRKLVRHFNALTVQDPATHFCPNASSLRFGLRLTGPGLAPIVANAGSPCDGVQVVIGGRTMPQLAGGTLADTEAAVLGTTVAALSQLAWSHSGGRPPT